MLTKLTSKNQVTLPAALLRELPAAEYFDASVEDGALVLKPVRVVPAVDVDAVRDRLAAVGVKPEETRKAVRWARRRTG
jgi:hypothetical protein